MKTRINNINFENVYVTDTETELLLQGDIDESVLTIDIDGEITVESTTGEGSTFTVIIKEN